MELVDLLHKREICCRDQARDGKEYLPNYNTLRQISCGFLCYIRELKPELDIFHDSAFTSFRTTLDAVMKRL